MSEFLSRLILSSYLGFQIQISDLSCQIIRNFREVQSSKFGNSPS